MSWAKDTFIGSGEKYNYLDLCVPTWPWAKKENKKKVPFYGKGECVRMSRMG